MLGRELMLRCLGGLSLAAIAVACAAAHAGEPSGGRVFGYFDPATNSFTPSPPPSVKAQQSAVSAPIVRSGTLEITADFTFDSAVPGSVTFRATAFARTVPAAAANPAFSSEVGDVGSVVRSGAKGTLTLSLPYAFTASSASDTVSINFTVNGSTGAYTNTTETIPLPADGAVTKVVFAQHF